MRREKIVGLALAAGLGLSGCTAARGPGALSSYESIRQVEPPRHSTEFNPYSGFQEWSELNQAPGRQHSTTPTPPPVPPAKGVSRVKSVSWLNGLGLWPGRGDSSTQEGTATTASTAVTEPGSETRPATRSSSLVGVSRQETDTACTEQCVPEGCDSTAQQSRSCLSRLLGKHAHNVGASTPGCTPCAKGCADEHTACGDSPAGSDAISDCREQWREDGARLQNSKPILADALTDSFSAQLENPFAALLELHPELLNSGRRSTSAVAPSTSTEAGVGAVDENEEDAVEEALPLWPRLRQTPQPIASTSTEPMASEAPVPESAQGDKLIPTNAPRTAAANGRRDAPLPTITARKKF